MPARSVTGAILAGGAGVRMEGRDKGLEPLAGRPLIGWVVDALRPQVDELLIVANRHLGDYARYAPAISDGAEGFRGPLAGLAAGLDAIRHDWMLSVPVDCARPPADLAARLLAAAAGGAPALVVHDGERRQPLFALYARRLAGSARRAGTDDMPVWRWQDAIGAQEVDCSALRSAFANLNTPEDFVEFERHLDVRS